MHRAGQIVWNALQELRQTVKPGVTTKDLDDFAERYTAEHDARPAFKGYMGYPGSLCTSINQEVVHGIPSRKRVLKEGDILSMDFGVELDGVLWRRGFDGAGGQDCSRARKAAAGDARIARPRD